MSVKLTTAYHKIKALHKRFRIVKGGMSSSKTYSILTLLFEIALTKPKTTITILTSTYPLLKDGVITDMSNIFDAAGISFSKWYNKSDKDLNIPNGSIIQFRNLDAIDQHKGKGSRRDYLFCNEVNRLSWLTLDPYIVRTDKAIIFDYNHTAHFFVDDLFIDTVRDDVDYITLTYKDNELIPAGELETIESRIAASKLPGAAASLIQWVNVFAYGMKGQLTERQIYNYNLCDEIPTTAKKINAGMDFGSSPDPTILVDLYIDGADLYADEVFCENNLLPEKIQGAERMSVVDKCNEVGYNKGQLIIGDTSGKVTILDMRKHGYNISAVKKNIPVIEGIQKVRSYNLFITKRSANIKKGIENWYWKVDSNGKIIPEPDKHEPDGLAAIRYGIMFYYS